MVFFRPIVAIIIFEILVGWPSQASENHPEYVILLHGFGHNAHTMNHLKQYLEQKSFSTYSIEYDSLTQDIDEIRSHVFSRINNFIPETGNIHFVGFSLGGLIVRSYLDQYSPENLGNVVLLGTPNQGTPLVDQLQKRWWFPIISPFKPPVLESLSVRSFQLFNDFRPIDYNLGVIAGRVGHNSFGIEIEGENDGHVPVESARVEGMREMIVLNIDHMSLIADRYVFFQTAHFFKFGRFLSSDSQ